MGRFAKENMYIDLIIKQDYMHPEFGRVRVTDTNTDKMTFKIRYISQPHKHYNKGYDEEHDLNSNFHQVLTKYE